MNRKPDCANPNVDPKQFEEVHTSDYACEDFDPKELEEGHTSEALESGSEIELQNQASYPEPIDRGASYPEPIVLASYPGPVTASPVKEIFEATRKCCIYEVPRDLRKINKEAYTPQMVSIGPLHHCKGEYLTKMEEQKKRYLQKLIGRTGRNALGEEFKSYIKQHQQKIRACYACDLKLGSDEFVEMIMHDVVFIFELFLMNYDRLAPTKSKCKDDILLDTLIQKAAEYDILLDTLIQKAAIKRDLQLLENQLPYFVLKELFSKLVYSGKLREREQFSDPFLTLALRFFFDSDHNPLRDSEYVLQHFTDLRRCALLEGFSPPKNSGYLTDLPCATKLHGSGVKFESIKNPSLVDIRCDYENINGPLQMIPSNILRELVLEIPRFEVFDWTEWLFRNVMALELLHYPQETHVCNFILFMDFLIDNVKDVDLLVERKIIFNCLGDNAAIAKMFNKLCLEVAPSRSCYYDIGDKLEKHYENGWNNLKATLKNVYFRDLWIGTGTVAAALLLLLTLVQTVCSILQVL